MRFPSYACYPYKKNETLRPRDECYVKGIKNKIKEYLSTEETCFPTNESDAVMVVDSIVVTEKGVFTFEVFLMFYVMIVVVCFLPVECLDIHTLSSQCRSLFCYCPPFFGIAFL